MCRIGEIVRLIADRDHIGFSRLAHVQCADLHPLFSGMYDYDIEAIRSPARNVMVEDIPGKPSHLLVTVELNTEGILDLLRLALFVDMRSDPHIIIVDALSLLKSPWFVIPAKTGIH